MLHYNCHQTSREMAYFKLSTSNIQNHLLSHNFKRSIKFFLCFSLICVLFSFLPLLFQPFTPSLMQFYSSYIVVKSYMFLLCNGLLALIALNSGLIDSFSPPTTFQSIESAVPIEKIDRLESKEPHIAVAAPIVVEKAESSEPEEKILMVVEQENVLSDTHEEEEGNALVMICDEDEDEDDEHDVDDTEELNKKCDDFIKRMKATFSSNNLEARVIHDFDLDNRKSMVSVN